MARKGARFFQQSVLVLLTGWRCVTQYSRTWGHTLCRVKAHVGVIVRQALKANGSVTTNANVQYQGWRMLQGVEGRGEVRS